MQELLAINALYQKHLHAIRQLTLTEWARLAVELNVEVNDREHAAKKLAIREYKA